MRKLTICLFLVAWCAVAVKADTINLGTAGSYAVLAGSTATNTGPTNVFGDLGLWPGTSITGFPPGIVHGTIHDSDAAAMQAQSDLTSAYGVAAGLPCGTTLTGTGLGGLTLTPGVYCFASSAQLTGTLTLNAEGDPNAFFLFQMGSTLTTASSSDVDVINGGKDANLFWQVGSSATLGTDTAFAGNILALTSITLDTRASIECGRALARNGAVTMDTNVVSIDSGCESGGGKAPEPGTLSLLSLGSCVIAFLRSKRR